IGELAFFDRLPRSASAVALTEVEALEIDFASLDEVYSKVPAYFKSILSSVADRLRKTSETVKRLQRDVITDEPIAAEDSGPSISEVLAATDPHKKSDPDDGSPGSGS